MVASARAATSIFMVRLLQGWATAKSESHPPPDRNHADDAEMAM
jgi:hypothetical protein